MGPGLQSLVAQTAAAKVMRASSRTRFFGPAPPFLLSSTARQILYLEDAKVTDGSSLTASLKESVDVRPGKHKDSQVRTQPVRDGEASIPDARIDYPSTCYRLSSPKHEHEVEVVRKTMRELHLEEDWEFVEMEELASSLGASEPDGMPSSVEQKSKKWFW
jgi:hypothetical protein